MARIDATIGLGLLLGASVFAVRAGEHYDNPVAGPGPCVVLEEYSVRPAATTGEPGGYEADVVIENICGRSVDVALCLVYAKPLEDRDRSCFGGLIRPWSRTEIRGAAIPTRASRPEYNWRYID